jgi:hypothetical protein
VRRRAGVATGEQDDPNGQRGAKYQTPHKPRMRSRAYRQACLPTMPTETDRVLGRKLARSWLQGAGRTLPEYLSAPSSQIDQKAATGS